MKLLFRLIIALSAIALAALVIAFPRVFSAGGLRHAGNVLSNAGVKLQAQLSAVWQGSVAPAAREAADGARAFAYRVLPRAQRLGETFLDMARAVLGK